MTTSTAVSIILAAFLLYRVLMRTRFRGILTRYIRKIRQSKITELKRKREFAQISALYRKRALRASRPYLKKNLLGLAALWDHDTQTAVGLLEQSAAGIVGTQNQRTVNNNLAIAYLQAGRYQDALELLNEQRRNGYVLIVPYVFALLTNRKRDEAKEFYAVHSLSDPMEAEGIRVLLSFDPTDPTTLDNVRELLDNQVFWLYEGVVRQLIQNWDLESFFARNERYEILLAQGKKLLAYLDTEPRLFSSPQLRWFRTIVSKIVPEIGTYRGCASLFGIIFGIERFVLELPMEPEWVAEAQSFWARLIYTFSRTVDLSANDLPIERARLRSLLPSDAVAVLGERHPRCELYVSKLTGVAIRVEQIYDARGIHSYVDLLAKPHAEALQEVLQPLARLLGPSPGTEMVLEPFIFNLVCYPERVAPSDVQEMLMQLPTHESRVLSDLGLNAEQVRELHSAIQ
ncbi:tetratricopeptide repeat protein [Alicyclobacillus ferrooxydans]|uniref:Tetratricopeptide repeat protein n=1 Tax=Alicyclobacillus ferrooxydans TaxID=471514 RepID=A0A0P9CRS6_9BACL|nr:tetratricopeptide repeat protein [Alicyclobacillus ferrooxydans]KPV42227.1 hypothetical protein AN477_18050 [Alicyclobacillus ferrooxydans]